MTKDDVLRLLNDLLDDPNWLVNGIGADGEQTGFYVSAFRLPFRRTHETPAQHVVFRSLEQFYTVNASYRRQLILPALLSTEEPSHGDSTDPRTGHLEMS